MITEKLINIPIYDVPLMVGIFDKEKEAIEKYPEIFTRGTKACVAEDLNTGDIFMIVPSTKLHHLAHECIHVINVIYKQKGIQPQRDNDEHEAYLMGFLFQKIEALIRKHNSN